MAGGAALTIFSGWGANVLSSRTGNDAPPAGVPTPVEYHTDEEQFAPESPVVAHQPEPVPVAPAPSLR